MEVCLLRHQFVESSLLLESSVLHDQDAVISLKEALFEVMCNNDPCDAVQVQNIGRDTVGCLCVERCRDLVSQQDG